MSQFALKTDLPQAPDLSGFARKSDLPVSPDLSGFALRSELPGVPDLSGVVRIGELEAQLRERDQTIVRLIDNLRAEEAMRASEIARLEAMLEKALVQPAPAPKTVEPDDLKEVYGIGPVLEKRLNRLGISTFAQIARWSDDDIDSIEPQLDTIQGRIRREGWVPDARRLHQAKYSEWIESPAI